MATKYSEGQYDVWQGYDGIWYWQVYKPSRDRMTSGNAKTEKQARDMARETIKKLICHNDIFKPQVFRFK